MLSLLLLATTACNKKDTPPLTSVEGKWQMIHSVGGIAGAEVQIKDKFVVVFQNNEYRYYVNDTLRESSTYKFEPVDGKTWKLSIIGNWAREAEVRFSGNLLIITDAGIDMYQSTYKKL